MPGQIAQGHNRGVTRSLRRNADDAEVVPPALCRRSDWLYAKTDRGLYAKMIAQGHNRGVNPLATW